jgi:protein phosphatase
MDPARPGAVLQTRWGAATDIGPTRDLNEDRWLARPPLFAVADGMGGHALGEVAARTALDALSAALSPLRLSGREADRADLEAAITAAAKAVASLAGDDAGEAGPRPAAPGTTLTGVLAATGAGRPRWLVFNIGDSRTSLVAGGRLRRLTRDHSAREEALHAPSAPRPGAPLPPANILTRALGAGMPGPPEPDVACAPALAGDRLVLCSDGVHGVVEEDLLCRIVREAPDPQSAADALVAEAIGRGTRDNATALVVEAVQAAPDLPDGQRSAEGRPVGGIGGEPGCSLIPPARRA